MYTEKEAKTKWCPMVRCEDESIAGNCYATVRDGKSTSVRNPDYSRCIASECMMWQWLENQYVQSMDGKKEFVIGEDRQGYCGLTK